MAGGDYILARHFHFYFLPPPVLTGVGLDLDPPVGFWVVPVCFGIGLVGFLSAMLRSPWLNAFEV